MKPGRLNVLHRQVGIALAPFLLLQGLTGFLLSLQEPAVGQSIKWQGPWHVVATLHYTPVPIHRIYLMLLAAGIVWMVITGSTLFLRGRRARAASAATGSDQREPPNHDH